LLSVLGRHLGCTVINELRRGLIDCRLGFCDLILSNGWDDRRDHRGQHYQPYHQSKPGKHAYHRTVHRRLHLM
jgi:hypothetical protein